MLSGKLRDNASASTAVSAAAAAAAKPETALCVLCR